MSPRPRDRQIGVDHSAGPGRGCKGWMCYFQTNEDVLVLYSFGTTLWRLLHVSQEAALLRVCRFPTNGQVILVPKRDPYSPGWHINQWTEAKEV